MTDPGRDDAEADAPTSTLGRFVGVGIESYTSPALGPLPAARTDVTSMRGLLPLFRSAVAEQTDETSLRAFLRELRTSMRDGGPLVVLWSGHGVRSPNGELRLLASDSEDFDADGIGINTLMAACVALRASQLLVIVDTCHSGGGAMSAVEVAAALMQARPPDAEHIWIGVLASAQPEEFARDGALGRLLSELVRSGPSDPVLQVRWSRHNRWLRGDDLCDAVIKQWTSEAHRPVTLSFGSAWFMLPNPLWTEHAHAGVVEHLLRAARAGAGEAEPPAFTGRQLEVDTVVGWVRSGEPGLHVVTGLPGTGKSAIVGRVVSLADPAERARILQVGGSAAGLDHADPGVGSIDAHVHARGLTADRMAELLADQLVGAGILGPSPTGKPRNAALLVGELQQHPEAEPPVIVVDGLDEARGEVFTIAADLLLRLAPVATVVVATREQSGPMDTPSLLSRLDPAGQRLDLSTPEAARRGRGDIWAYVAVRLRGRHSSMDPEQVADLLVERTGGDESFLLARVVTDAVLASPVDTSVEGWQSNIALSLFDAMDSDMASIPVPAGRSLPEGRTSGELAGQLLTALTWAYGAGLPMDEWVAVANAIGPLRDVTAADATWALDNAARYIVQDGEGDVAVYRVAHQSVADLLRTPFRPGKGRLFDEAALPVCQALLLRYGRLLQSGVHPVAPTYLWRYAYRHVADAGPDGLALLVPLTVLAPQLRTDLGTACFSVAAVFGLWGRAQDAIPLSEQSVGLYREATASAPAMTGDLAMALNNLGIAYGQVGRVADAMTATEEAVGLFRALKEADPAYESQLAGALTSLSLWCPHLGRAEQGLAAAQESVALYRDVVARNPAETAGLARALTGLGATLALAYQPHESLAATQEAVALYREALLTDDTLQPALATALMTLAGRHTALGQLEEALGIAVVAVEASRQAVDTNPVYLSDLPASLSTLAVTYVGLGRAREALEPMEEAVALYRQLADDNPAAEPALVRALITLSYALSSAGRTADALAPVDEALALVEQIVTVNPTVLAEVARVRMNRATLMFSLRDPASALDDTQAAIAAYRPLCAEQPGLLPELAIALSCLGQWHLALGQPTEAAAPLGEAEPILRGAAATNPLYLAELARALTNIGVHRLLTGDEDSARTALAESVAINRGLANNSTVLPDLARSLTYLASVTESEDGLALLTAAEGIYRQLVLERPNALVELARTRAMVGRRQDGRERYAEAISAYTEAIEIFRQLLPDHPDVRSELPEALLGLAGSLRSGDPGVAEPANAAEAAEVAQEAVLLFASLFRDTGQGGQDLARALTLLRQISIDREREAIGRVESGLADERRAELYVARSVAAPGDPQVPAWLSRAASIDPADRVVRASLHDEVRRLAADPGFVGAWFEETGRPLPEWASVDPALLASTRAWADTATYAEERDYLLAHPELLAPTADDAVEEGLLGYSEKAASRCAATRAAARVDGVEAAYRALVDGELARLFVSADGPGRQDLLVTRREELLGPGVEQAVARWSEGEDEQATAAQSARAMLAVARIELDAPVFAALEYPEQFRGLLDVVAREHPDLLMEVAMLANADAQNRDDATVSGLAFLYASVAWTRVDLEQAKGLVVTAFELDPTQRDQWLDLLAQLLPIWPGAARLIAPLAMAELPPG